MSCTGAIPWISACSGSISTIDSDVVGTIGYATDPPTPPENLALGLPIQSGSTGSAFTPSSVVMVDALDEAIGPDPEPPPPPSYSGRFGTGEQPGGDYAEF